MSRLSGYSRFYWTRLLGLCVCALLGLGCPEKPPADSPRVSTMQSAKVEMVNVGPRIEVLPLQSLTGARNETLGFALSLGESEVSREGLLQVRPPKLNVFEIPLAQLSFYQIVPMPVDLNRAEYIRQSGEPSSLQRLPRALIPLAQNNGLIDLRGLQPVPGPTLIWIDLKIPLTQMSGSYNFSVDLLSAETQRAVTGRVFGLNVLDLTLPDVRHLALVAPADWDDLVRLWPDRFSGLSPRLLSRLDSRHAPAVKTLDDLMRLAQDHRVNLIIPKLTPDVKWPVGQEPQIDWRDYQSVVSPWLDGGAFSDKLPVTYWPLPQAEALNNFSLSTQVMYWHEASVHFNQYEGWLDRSGVLLNPPHPGPLSEAEVTQYNRDAAVILGAHEGLRVAVPIEADRIELNAPDRPGSVSPARAHRLSAVASAIVSTPPRRDWPENVARPTSWLRTDLPGFSPYMGAGADERDFRATGALAYQRQAEMVLLASSLPNHTYTQSAPEDAIPWFYPGSWFGSDKPVPTLQLKWLRRAEQDYEYFFLARQRGQVISSRMMARQLARPVELIVNQPIDPIHALMTGTVNQSVWQNLPGTMARTILSAPPGKVLDLARQTQIYLQSMRWVDPMQRPLVVPRQAHWMWDTLNGKTMLAARLVLDIYNPSDDAPDHSELRWAEPMPSGWIRPSAPTNVGTLPAFHVSHAVFDGHFDLRQLRPASRGPLTMILTDGYTRRDFPVRFNLPIAASVRRESPIDLNGSLEDWSGDDALHTGPLTKMIDRPSLLAQQPQPAATDSSVYSNWSDEQLYFAFKLDGLQTRQGRRVQNFVRYDLRRGWGEDLAQFLIQPVYADNSVGPLLHIAYKPTGIWVEMRRSTPDGLTWQPIEGASIRFGHDIDPKDVWRGEMAIPWKILTDPTRGRPTLLRFNFIQHKPATGESASWAGPIDSGRDDQFMGLLVLLEPDTPGMRK